MAETVVIEFVGSTEGLKPLVDAMKALGTLTEEQETAFNSASKAYQDFLTKSSTATQATVKDVAGLNNALKQIPEAVAGAAVSDGFKKIGANVEIATGSTQKLITQLRNLKNQIAQLEPGSAQFIKLATEAGKLEQRINKTNQQVRLLASQAGSLNALLIVGQGIAGAFTAAQGAAALFGAENENVQKAILKVQGALALLQGVQASVIALKDLDEVKTTLQISLQRAYAFVVGESTGALRLFKLALAATGIGLIVIAIGELIANWDKLTVAIFGAKEEVKDFAKESELALAKNSEAVERIKDRFDISQKSTKDLSEEVTRLKKSLEELPRQSGIEIIVNGKTIKQNIDKTRAQILEQIKSIEDEIKKRDVLNAPKLKPDLTALDEIERRIEQIDKKEIEIELKVSDPREAENAIDGFLEKKLKSEMDADKEKRDLIKNTAIQGAQQISDTIFQINSNRRNAELAEDIKKLEQKRESELSNKDLTEAQKASINARFARQEANLKRKAFEADKQAKLAQASEDFALSQITLATKFPPPSPQYFTGLAILTIGFLTSLAKIASTKPPAFARGTKSGPGSMALVGEEGAELTYIPKGAKVIPHPQTMKILQGHADSAQILSNYNIPAMPDLIRPRVIDMPRSKQAEIDYDRLAKAIGKELKESPRYEINVDEGGATVKVINGLNERSYINKRFSIG